ncbi:hypothetical protein ACFZCY_38995 [Streptomyces sp. NPDC007983]|uniref:hypothetical protein n=1 Tax=Streptomyces sp. NPDC007983 TaxID=3364800 RepID=UPI0036EE659C
MTPDNVRVSVEGERVRHRLPDRPRRRPRIILIWVADVYRHRGVGAALVQALVDDFGGHVADVSWSAPISSAGQRLARRLSSKGIWIS